MRSYLVVVALAEQKVVHIVEGSIETGKTHTELSHSERLKQNKYDTIRGRYPSPQFDLTTTAPLASFTELTAQFPNLSGWESATREMLL